MGDSEGQGSLACCSSWGEKDSDVTWRLNSNNWVTFRFVEFQASERNMRGWIYEAVGYVVLKLREEIRAINVCAVVISIHDQLKPAE